jgi:hypothetical protein
LTLFEFDHELDSWFFHDKFNFETDKPLSLSLERMKGDLDGKGNPVQNIKDK